SGRSSKHPANLAEGRSLNRIRLGYRPSPAARGLCVVIVKGKPRETPITSRFIDPLDVKAGLRTGDDRTAAHGNDLARPGRTFRVDPHDPRIHSVVGPRVRLRRAAT